MDDLIQILNAAKVERKVLRKDLRNKKRVVAELKRKFEIDKKAKWIIAEVVKLTQNRFKEKAEKLITMAIQPVFNRPFKMELRSSTDKADRLEVNPIISEYDNEYIPEDDLGGSMADLIEIPFKVVMVAMSKARKFLLMDEPFENMGTGDELLKAVQFLKWIAYNLSYQLIIITHEDSVAEIADRAWRVTHDGIESHVGLIKGSPKRKLKRRK